MHKNKSFLFFFFLLIFSVGVLSAPGVDAAGLNYTLLEKIPFLANTDGSNLPAYVAAVYKTAMVVIVLSALFMLSVGGFMYLTSAGNTSAMGTAKSVIFDSLIGLVIALTAWLLLNVINPDLVSVTINGLSATPVTVAPGGVPITPGIPPTGTTVTLANQIAALGVLQGSGDCSSSSGTVSPQSDIQNIIDGKAMSVCSNGCKSSGSSGCTDNIAQPSGTMLQAIIAVKGTLSFTITSIAGGSHAPNSDHYAGRAIDITPATQILLDAFITNGAVRDVGNMAGSFCESAVGREVTCASGQADHIHIKFSN